MGAVVLGAAWLHTYLWASGDRTFVTHPVSVLALAAAALGVASVARRGRPGVRRALDALSLSLAAYLLLGAVATAAPNPLSAGAWSVAWLLPNVLLATVGLVSAGLARLGWALAASTLPVAVAGGLLVEPAVPFEGIATASPQAWEAAGAVDALLLGWNLALLGAVVLLGVRAARASVVDRGRLARAAAVASTAPCLVATCLALAVLRDPGEVDPSAGSVAYLVAVAGTAVLAAKAVSSDGPRAVRAVATQWGASVVVILGVLVAGSVAVTLGVVLVGVLTLAVGAATHAAVRRHERWSAPPAPRPVTAAVPRLSARENDVLAGVASGRTNAGIAEDLFLSERTVEQHLRSIFEKLDLGVHGDTNRRVRAAAVWWQHQPDPAAVDVS